MTTARLVSKGRGRWSLVGTLDFASVPGLWKELSALIADHAELSLSLRSVSAANSAGLVLLLEARDLARRSGCRLSFVDVPPELIDLASMSQVETLIAGRTAG